MEYRWRDRLGEMPGWDSIDQTATFGMERSDSERLIGRTGPSQVGINLVLSCWDLPPSVTSPYWVNFYNQPTKYSFDKSHSREGLKQKKKDTPLSL